MVNCDAQPRLKKFSDSPLLRDLVSAICAPDEAFSSSKPYSCCSVIACTAEKNIVYARFVGDIDIAGVEDFSNVLQSLITEQVVKIILDLSRVSLSRTAIGMLVAYAGRIHGKKKRLYLYAPTDQVLDTLRELQIEGFFTYLRSQDDIIATLIV